MRVALIGDSHFDESSRFEECIRLHDWIAHRCAELRVDLVCHSGDMFERKSTPRERFQVAKWLQLLAAVAPVVIVRGNHDAVEDLPLYEKIDAHHTIDVIERVGICRPILENHPAPAIACMGWPQKAWVASQSESLGQRTDLASDALRNTFRWLGSELAALEQPPEAPKLFLGHAMVRGSRVSTGQPLTGCEFEIGLDDLGLVGADAYLLGHVHMGQDWMINGAPVLYPGSPRRTAYGELEDKGFVVLEFTEGLLTNVDRHVVPAARMFLLEEEWGVPNVAHETEPTWLCGDWVENEAELKGAEVRWRYHVPSDLRESGAVAARDVEAKLRALGAKDVKLDEVVKPTNRARAPEIAEAKTLEEKLESVWRVRGFDPGARRDALFGKLREVA